MAAVTILLAQVVHIPFAISDVKYSRAIDTKLEKYTDDWDGILNRKVIRLLVPYSQTLFYQDNYIAKGTSVKSAQQFEIYINKKYGSKGTLPFTAVLVPTTREKLIIGLLEGNGDIALGNITITSERKKIVDFSIPIGKPFSQIIVTSKDHEPLNQLEDLSGMDIYVRKSTSYYESLQLLNKKFIKERKPPVRLIYLPDELEDEDKMSMVNAGLISATVVDEWIVKLWSSVFTEMRVYSNIKLSQNDRIGCAIRKSNPKLKAIVDEFIEEEINKTGLYNILIRQSEYEIKKLGNIRQQEEREKYQKVVKIFKQYGEKYKFDYLMLIAQAYQESRLDHSVRSPSGAVGIMQLLPSTGKAMKVGDIYQLEHNIHAAVKYMDHIVLEYLADSTISDQNRILLAFASYNAGPTRIAMLRKKAVEAGFDPNTWFNNVENMAAREIGQETVTYVRNIFKYYVAYKLLVEKEINVSKVRDQFK